MAAQSNLIVARHFPAPYDCLRHMYGGRCILFFCW